MAGPSNPHKRLPTSALHERGIAVKPKGRRRKKLKA
jgi:2-methylcitrate dehydratase (2-methyl-trans-aconitate forming)